MASGMCAMQSGPDSELNPCWPADLARVHRKRRLWRRLNMTTSLVRRLLPLICVASLLSAAPGWRAGTASPEADPELLRVYGVGRRVCDFPEEEDFSTPEASYAVINRVLARGEQGAWRRISVKWKADRLSPPDAPTEEVPSEVARVWLEAEIVEVRIFQGRYAGVIAKLHQPTRGERIDLRHLEMEDGRWLNVGHGFWGSLEEARSWFARSCGEYVQRPGRTPVDDPDSYLQPFVHFLESHGEEPRSFAMKALADHRLVIMGEWHHRPRYWAFNSSLVTHPDFPEYVGTIYMELPSNDQRLIDEFLAGGECHTHLVIQMLRDVLWMGWPDQAMLDFFVTVWRVNRDLESTRRLRIVLVDMQRPWQEIHHKDDWKKYTQVSRDRQMADNTLADMREHPRDNRHSLFIVGVGHTMLDLEFFDGSPVASAGWYLRRELGPESVYAFCQHGPVGTNVGQTDGRPCLGLFDSAFAAIGNRPVAFPLTTGPFGEQPFDVLSDLNARGAYRDGYSAYLYLGPIDHEIFSPLIPGFYTDEFVRELDRRYRIESNVGLVEGCGLERLDAESFIAWMSYVWGKPRPDWTAQLLGPTDAWHRGGRTWKEALREEKHARVTEHFDEVLAAARTLLEGIRDADYDYFLGGREPDLSHPFPTVGRYMANTRHDLLIEWICKTFRQNPIMDIQLGDVFLNDDELPTVPYKLTLRDGAVLAGDLPFEYLIDDEGGHWHGKWGLDWHLQGER